MGKRSSFKRKARDYYPTPSEAVEPLIPFINGSKRFAEPCAGNGALIKHLEKHKLKCVYRGDIRTGKDARLIDRYARGNYKIITNPPHTRAMMHELITHFQEIAPTWLLIDLDWVSNLQAVPYLKRCSHIVVIGRVKWFKNSEHTGKENYAWYRFDGSHRGSTQIINRRGLA